MAYNITRRVFLLGVGAFVGTAMLGSEIIKRAGLVPGADPALDAEKNTYLREQLRAQTVEGSILAAGGEPLTDAQEEGVPATVRDISCASLVGMGSKRFGRSGLRAIYDDELCYADKPHGHGCTIQTTVNLPLQQAAYRLLNTGRRGAFCLLDADSGQMLVLAERASGMVEFEINPSSITEEKMALFNSQSKFWFSPATTSCLQPGSVQKIVDAAAIFASGIEETYFDTGVSATGIHNAGNAVYGDGIDVRTMLERSINTFAADMTPRVGAELYEATVKNFFYNSTVETDWGATLAPKLEFDPDDLAAWQQLCIGQGAIQTSPLHLALLVGSVLNPMGEMVKPYVVEGITSESGEVRYQNPGPEVVSTPLADQAVRTRLMDALEATARGYELEAEGAVIIGKTGTATKENSALNDTFLAFALETPQGRRLCGCLSQEETEGTSAQLKPVVREFVEAIVETEKRGAL